jgi:hypothetical protein
MISQKKICKIFQVFGHVFARANNISQLVKQKQVHDKVEWLDKMYNS